MTRLEEIDRKISALMEAYLHDRSAETSFDEIVGNIHALHYAFSPSYRARCNSLGVPAAITRAEQVPVASLSKFKGKEVPCMVPNDGRGMSFRTSGTSTGIPTTIYRDQGYFAIRNQSVVCQGRKQWFSRYLPGKVTLIFLDAANRNNSPMFRDDYSVLNTMRTAFGNGESRFIRHREEHDAVVSIIDRSRAADRPIVLVGPSYHFSEFVAELAARNATALLGPSSLLMDSGGLKNRGRHKDTKAYLNDLTTRLGVVPGRNYVNTYAMTETGCQLSNAPGTAYKQVPPWVRARVVDDQGAPCKDGQAGNLVLVDLLNRANLLAIETGDLAVLRPEGLEVLGRR
ncbi:hypothetical protein [Azospirillum sp. B506]|uniref:LuxE/PaaK family acyltransferase n=1 Tax=Azospirillum sp. B506 TaxID=137721 RepID=UPI0011DCA13E|nr:hypothetical protein [Azospirillum sp. B506]